ncbi:MAG: dienelactone hydrolase family protein [bacterium]
MRYASIGYGTVLFSLFSATGAALPAATTNDEKSLTVMHYLGERATQMSSELPAIPETLKAWERRRKVVQRQLAARLGLPERVPMRAKITQTAEEGDLIVEEVMYLWADNAYVAANVVRPKTGAGALPGLVVPPGWMGDLQQEFYKPFVYQMARKGYVILFIDDPHVRKRAAPCEGLYCAASAAGIPCMGIQVFDTLRGFDYLLTRSDVDPHRIGIAGLCQGSEQTWLAAALEERFKIAVPVCGTTTYEQWVRMPAFLSVNLSDPSPYVANVLSDSDWDEIGACIAPRPVYVASNSGDNWWPKPGYQKVISTMEKVYQLYQKPDNFKNLFVLRSHSMTPFLAELAPWIDQQLKGLPATATFTPAPCALPENPTFSMLEYAQQRIIRQTDALPKTFGSKRAWVKYREHVAAWLSKSCGLDSLKGGEARKASCEVRDGLAFETVLLPQDKDFHLPVLLAYPDSADVGKRPAVIFSCDGGASILDDDVVKLAACLARDGYVVCVPDHPNVNPKSRRSVASLVSFYGCSDSVGLPPVAMRVRDDMSVFSYLRQREGIDVSRIAVVGLGLGGVDAAIAATVEPRIAALGVTGAITVRDWADSVAPHENEFHYWAPYLHEITQQTDLQYIYSAAAPRPLLLVDGTYRNFWPEAGYRRVSEMADCVFQLYGKPGAVTKQPAKSGWGIEEIRQWLGSVLKSDKPTPN